jgi:putative isomerase
MISSHPPVWPEIAWKLYLATGDRSWLAVTYEVAKLNIAWWERERDRDKDGLFEYADTRYPQPWESGCDGSPRFDEMSSEGFACVDLNAQLVMFYRNLVRFAVELGERGSAAQYAQRQDRLAHLVRTRLYDGRSGWFFDRGEEGFIDVRTTAGLWTVCAGIPTPAQLDAMIEQVENPLRFGTWFPLPSVAADEPKFESVSWRGPSWPSQVLWFAMGLREMHHRELAGRLVRRTLDAMAEVLRRDGVIYEFYNPHGPETRGLRLFDFSGAGEPVRRCYLGHAPVRAMVLSGLLGIEPVREGLLIDPAEASLPADVSVEFFIAKNPCTLETHKRKEGLEVVLRRGKKTVASSFGKLLVPRGEIF